MELDFLEQMLSEENEPTLMTGKYPIPEQRGPLRQYEKYSRCASRGCSSPTFFKLQGVPYCQIHSLRKMNDMLLELGIEQ